MEYLHNLEIKFVGLDDNLHELGRQIDLSEWDGDNEIDENDFTSESLKAYLCKQDAISVVCYLITNDVRNLAGIASVRIEQKPHNFSKWLYIDELDVCSSYRHQGVGTALMRGLLESAKKNNCEEIWLGAETDKLIPNEFYKSLKPDAIDSVTGYTFKLS